MILPSLRYAPWLLTYLALAVQACHPDSSDLTRTIELQTEEVTTPDVAIAPDGSMLVFSLLGHLFRMPITGGTAIQMTTGPCYNDDPIISPDGRQLAFISNRDGSEGNVFVMDLETSEITQVTHVQWASRPAWSPNGQSLLYLSYVDGIRSHETIAQVHEVTLENKVLKVLEPNERYIRSVFYTAGGRPGWCVVEEADGDQKETLIELATEGHSPVIIATISGEADRVTPSSVDGDFYFHRNQEWDDRQPIKGQILRISSESIETTVTNVDLRYSHYGNSRFAVAPDDLSIFIGNGGYLWRVSTVDGTWEEIPFQATVQLQIALATPVPTVALPRVFNAPTISTPRLTPDGQTLIFGAYGFLWKQFSDKQKAERLTDDNAFEREPAISPEGRHLAYVRTVNGEEELRILDLESGDSRTLHRGSIYWDITWHMSGDQIVVALSKQKGFTIIALDLDVPAKEYTITRTGVRHSFSPRPNFSRDGQWLYYRQDNGDATTIQRISLAADTVSQPIIPIHRYIANALVSPDGSCLAFRRNRELWIAPLNDNVSAVSDESGRQISPTGGTSFAFTPDGQSLIYAAGGRVWKYTLTDRATVEVPIHLVVNQEVAPPLLLKNVRLLDFSSGTFGREVSMFVDGGRIRWVDSNVDHEIPAETQVLNAKGRYAIPGLIDVHNHVGPGFDKQIPYIAYGVTTVRDMGGQAAWVATLAERSSLTSSPIPRYLFSGDFLVGRPRHFASSLLVRNADQTRSGIRRHKDAGASFIKVYWSVSWPLELVATAEARTLGLPIAAHGMDVLEIVRGVTLGHRFLEHLESVGRLYDDVQQLLAISGTYLTPTLSWMGTGILLMKEHRRLPDAKFCAFFPRSCGSVDESQAPQLDSSQGGWFERMMQTSELADLREARTHGVNVLAGTDTPDLPGVYIHIEMESFVLAGLTPLEVLELSTQRAAEALGVAQDIGSLEVGKLADIVLLNANPLDDIKHSQSIWRIIKGGWVFDPEKLQLQL